MERLASVTFEKCWLVLSFKQFWKTEILNSANRLLSILIGDRFELVKVFENSSVQVWLKNILFNGIYHVYFEKLSYVTKLYISFFLTEIYSQTCPSDQYSKLQRYDSMLFCGLDNFY